MDVRHGIAGAVCVAVVVAFGALLPRGARRRTRRSTTPGVALSEPAGQAGRRALVQPGSGRNRAHAGASRPRHEPHARGELVGHIPARAQLAADPLVRRRLAGSRHRRRPAKRRVRGARHPRDEPARGSADRHHRRQPGRDAAAVGASLLAGHARDGGRSRGAGPEQPRHDPGARPLPPRVLSGAPAADGISAFIAALNSFRRPSRASPTPTSTRATTRS